MFYSNVLKLDPVPAIVLSYILEQMSEEGFQKIELPTDILAPREISVNDGVPFMAFKKTHRDEEANVTPEEEKEGKLRVPGARETCVEPEEAKRLVEAGDAKYEKQYALIFSMETYLGDNDVKRNEKEFKRATDSGEDFVLVSIVGASRYAGPLTTLRNIITGCYKKGKEVEICQGALDNSGKLLIEERPTA